MGSALIGPALFGLVGCNRSERPPGPGGPQTSATSADGSAQQGAARGRCTRQAGAPSLAIGSQAQNAASDDAAEDETEGEGAEPASALAGTAVEFARAAEDDGTFLLGLLTQEKDTRAGVAVLSAVGSARYLDLGHVEGQTEPPRVAARGGHWLALLTDQGPKGPVLRVTGISRHEQLLETKLGPEVKKATRDPAGADVAVLSSGQAMLVWDRLGDKGEAEIMGLPIDARSLRERSSPLLLSPPGQSASEPRLLAANAGYWLLWLVEERAPVAPVVVSASGLLDEPAKALFARELDEAGRPRGAAVLVHAAEPAPLVDARVLPSGRLLVAVRSAPADRPTDDQPILLSTLDPDGTLERRPPLGDELLGPGAPGLFGRTGADVSWLALEEGGGTSQLARVLADGSVRATPVTGLGGHIALAGDPSRLLTAEPRGIGVSLQILTCSVE